MHHIPMRRLLLCAMLGLVGCSTQRTDQTPVYAMKAGSTPLRSDYASTAPAAPDRMIAWRSQLTMEVGNVSNAVDAAIAITGKLGGLVERRSDGDDGYASLTLRIPSTSLSSAISEFETLGTITHRNLSGDDVTEQYVDTESRLNNKRVLRDRLLQLLDKAVEVKDILAIETELNRVQSDIESMEAVITSLSKQVEMATIQVQFKRKPILGPVGYVLKGIWWGFSKLFVIRS
jgi:hypothetical protein